MHAFLSQIPGGRIAPRLFPRCRRRALTLIEMMVSITITLIIMGTVMTIFGSITGAVADNRAVMETVDRLKSATARLQADLQGRTAPTLPWDRLEAANGYFEYIEGPGTDSKPQAEQSWNQIPKDDETQALASGNVLGDVDDVLMFTARARGAPFVGRGPNGPIESYLAEIVWFVKPAETDTQRKPLTLYRRVLLIVSPEQMQGGGGGGRREFFEKNDISAHMDTQTGQMTPNTLADLTMPENRFAHTGGGAKVGSVQLGTDSVMRPFPLSGERYGEDVVMTNIVGFDIKAFDPWGGFGGAADDQTAMVPGDFSYQAGASGRGLYVDLGGPGGGDYTGIAREESMLANVPGVRAVFDTFSFHYEHDGYTQRGAKDRATDLLDGDGAGGIDDGTERETCAPFLRPLRGIEVSVRAYEPDSRQVQQVTVVGDFMPR